MPSDTTTPQTLIGHQQRWAAVQRAYTRGKIPQTLMISGPSHLGKRTFARRLSQLLLCPQASPENPNPCGTCRVCHQVEIETFPDFKVYRPLIGASEKDVRDRNVAPRDLEGSIIPIAIARDFGEEAMMKPLVGKRKVMLIESADRLSIEAQNALLKTFEEPINGLSIVLLCDNPGALLSTVLSRAWHLPLGLAADNQNVVPGATGNLIVAAMLGVGAPRPTRLKFLKALWRQGANAKHRGDYEVARRAWNNILIISPNHPNICEALMQLPKRSGGKSSNAMGMMKR